MKYLVYAFSSLNLYLGARFLLNAIGILQTSKYAPLANVFYAIILTAIGALAFYLSISKDKHGLALLIDAAPWIITLIILIVSMVFGDYK